MTNRRTFLKQLAIFGGVLTAGSLFPSSFGKLENRPLEVLALGDSVVWGQGLKEGNKFTTLVCNWLKIKTGREINFHREAHSGATIYPKSDESKPLQGEINVSLPSIFQQIKNSTIFYKNRDNASGGKLNPESVDLIFVDGGINDLHATKILFAKTGKLTEKAKEFCYTGMKELLAEIIKTYPNARIVVTGYFPLISMKSNQTEVFEVVTTLLGDNKIQDTFAKIIRGILNKFPDKYHLILKGLAERSDVWYKETNSNLKKAVGAINDGETKNSPRVLFAETLFAPENSYAVEKTTFLWQLIAKIETDDELFEDRKEICKAAPNKLTCHRAGIFHPNREGAKAYAKAIENELEKILDTTGWKS